MSSIACLARFLVTKHAEFSYSYNFTDINAQRAYHNCTSHSKLQGAGVKSKLVVVFFSSVLSYRGFKQLDV